MPSTSVREMGGQKPLAGVPDLFVGFSTTKKKRRYVKNIRNF